MHAVASQEALERLGERPAHHELRVPVRAEDHHGYAVQVLYEVLEEKEGTLVRPVEVVEQHHHGRDLRGPLHELTVSMEEVVPPLIGGQFDTGQAEVA